MIIQTAFAIIERIHMPTNQKMRNVKMRRLWAYHSHHNNPLNRRNQFQGLTSKPFGLTSNMWNKKCGCRIIANGWDLFNTPLAFLINPLSPEPQMIKIPSAKSIAKRLCYWKIILTAFFNSNQTSHFQYVLDNFCDQFHRRSIFVSLKNIFVSRRAKA